jgi:hypothetical protein
VCGRRAAGHHQRRDTSLPESKYALIAWIGIQPWCVWVKVTLFAVILLLTTGIVGWIAGTQVLTGITSLLH